MVFHFFSPSLAGSSHSRSLYAFYLFVLIVVSEF